MFFQFKFKAKLSDEWNSQITSYDRSVHENNDVNFFFRRTCVKLVVIAVINMLTNLIYLIISIFIHYSYYLFLPAINQTTTTTKISTARDCYFYYFTIPLHQILEFTFKQLRGRALLCHTYRIKLRFQVKWNFPLRTFQCV